MFETGLVGFLGGGAIDLGAADTVAVIGLSSDSTCSFSKRESLTA